MAASESEQRIIPLSEVAQHAQKPQQVWIAVDGFVYNITEFLDEHPGGPEIVLEHAGKDATKDFDEIGHSKAALAMMTKYRIGALPEGEGIRRAVASGKASGAAGGSTSSDDSSNMGTWLLYLVPVLLLGFGVWYQFLRPAA